MPDHRPAPIAAALLAEGRAISGTPYRRLRRLDGATVRWEIEHVGQSRRFALEILPRPAARHLARLQRDWQALGRRGHPNIARVRDAGRTADGEPFCVIERLQGQTLGTRCRTEGRLRAGLALSTAAQVLSALDAAHGIGIVHGSVQPENVWLDSNGSVKLLGFGRARGKPPLAPLRYAAPEQLEGGAFDFRADLYPVGLMLYEMLTGEHPPGDHDRSRPSRTFATLAAGLPPEVELLIARLMNSDPKARPQSAAQVAARMRQLAAELSGRGLPIDAPTRHAGYDALTVGCPSLGARTEVDLRPAWLEHDPTVTRPDGPAARRGNVEMRDLRGGWHELDATTLVAHPNSAVSAEPRVATRSKPPAGAPGRSRAGPIGAVWAALRVFTALGALGACAALAGSGLAAWSQPHTLHSSRLAPDSPSSPRSALVTTAPSGSLGLRPKLVHVRQVLVKAELRRRQRAAHRPPRVPVRETVEAPCTSCADRSAPFWSPDIPANPYPSPGQANPPPVSSGD